MTLTSISAWLSFSRFFSFSLISCTCFLLPKLWKMSIARFRYTLASPIQRLMYTVPSNFSVRASWMVSPKIFSSNLEISSSSVTASLYRSLLSRAVAIFLLALMTRLSSGEQSSSQSVLTFWMQVSALSGLLIFSKQPLSVEYSSATSSGLGQLSSTRMLMASSWISMALWQRSISFISASMLARSTSAKAYSTFPPRLDFVCATTQSMTASASTKFFCLQQHCALRASVLMFFEVSLYSPRFWL